MTLYELILSAKYNVCENGQIGLMVGKVQLEQIEKELLNNKELHDEIDED